MKIFVEKNNDKFINNLILSLNWMGIETYSSEIDQDLYKIYHYYPFNVGVFVASKFNHETAQFIAEFYSRPNTKMIVYHDIYRTDIESDFSKAAIHIRNDKEYDKVKIPELVNHFLFRNVGLERKKNSYAVFLDNSKELPEDLGELLYPNTKLHINMFNSSEIQHHQNLGLISEIDKANILNTYEFFIDIHHNYANEARLCGSKVVDVAQIKNHKKPRNPKNINAETYKNFIRSTIL